MPRRERPLDEGESGLLRFAADLRRLRERAGSPTYRELSRRAHYSAAALSEAAGGRKLPSLAVTMAYAKACDADPEEWARRWRAVVESEPRGGNDSPYVGLAMFQPGDAPKFFGRERLTAELLTTRNRFTGVFGPSGAGKSSLLRAGLIARTREPVLLFTPGANPVEECAIALARLTGGEAAALAGELEDPGALCRRHPHLVVVDQFEELFTLCRNEELRRWLIKALIGCPKVVIGVRADYYGHCAQYPDLVDALEGAQLLLGPMTSDELRLAITEPAAVVGAKVETALLARLMADAMGQAAVLPLLSHALAQTWQHRRGMTLTLSGYEEVGGLEHAVARTAQEVFDGLSAAGQEQARQILLRLVTADGTKRRAHQAELEADDEVLFALAAARLVVIDRDGVELAHEALIRSWPTFQRWVEEDRENIKAQRELTHATQTWESLDRDPGVLWRGRRLVNVPAGLSLNAKERAFLAASLAAEEEASASARRRTRRQRQLLAALAALVVVAASSTAFALRAGIAADEQRANAAVLRAVGEAAALRSTNPALAQQVALAAYQLVPLPQARNGLRQEDVPSQVLREAQSEVTALVVGPTQQQVATGHRDGTVVLTTLDDLPSPRTSHDATRHSGAVTALAMDSTGGLIASAADDGTVHLVDVSLGRPRELAALPVRATAIAWQGGTLVTTGADGALSFWTDLRHERPRLLTTAQPGLGPLAAMSFRPDGQVLAAVTTGHAVHLVDVSDPRDVKLLSLTREFAGGAQFAGADRLMTTAGTAVHLWDTTDPRDPVLRAAIRSGGGEVTAAWLAAGRVAVATDDGLVRLWLLGDGEPVEQALLRGHTGPVTAVGLTPRGDEVVTGGADRAVRLWNADPRDPAVRICEQAFPRMSREQWAQYFGDLDFAPPCRE
ncbi:WD domain-containing protein, G-beta repeat-containing protein [Lentzea albidocapillata subsp. violacea]|uniref:WD domain-containing protein, G-beta repeat-containing protein n=1 Tax=Lentzea albidocapillata subsp. violacea TaxID=128104 RepID=A0A1G9EDQ1_9PSEU|nr:helix-turn-helix domain-containing protein [Lentzea albidocapillata]SDK74244.1 WD domain-containing protein, G-beta repeat-containing protein [Lentzea albidocapillata subsp. violacea]